jgi:Tfp pilus assembly protein FimT
MKRADDGISLVEVLIVLAIIAAVVSMAVLSTGSADRSGRAGLEAQQFAARLSLAADKALTSGQPVLLTWSEDRYVFEAYSAAHADRLSGQAERTLPRALQLTGTVARPFVIGPDQSGAARWKMSDGRQSAVIVFDGLTAQVVHDDL